MVLFGVVDKTAGGPNQDIDAAFQHFQLFIVAVAAVGRAKFQAGGLRQGSASAWICTASSRVGAIISARGWLTLRSAIAG